MSAKMTIRSLPSPTRRVHLHPASRDRWSFGWFRTSSVSHSFFSRSDFWRIRFDTLFDAYSPAQLPLPFLASSCNFTRTTTHTVYGAKSHCTRITYNTLIHLHTYIYTITPCAKYALYVVYGEPYPIHGNTTCNTYFYNIRSTHCMFIRHIVLH